MSEQAIPKLHRDANKSEPDFFYHRMRLVSMGKRSVPDSGRVYISGWCLDEMSVGDDIHIAFQKTDSTQTNTYKITHVKRRDHKGVFRNPEHKKGTAFSVLASFTPPAPPVDPPKQEKKTVEEATKSTHYEAEEQTN